MFNKSTFFGWCCSASSEDLLCTLVLKSWRITIIQFPAQTETCIENVERVRATAVVTECHHSEYPLPLRDSKISRHQESIRRLFLLPPDFTPKFVSCESPEPHTPHLRRGPRRSAARQCELSLHPSPCRRDGTTPSPPFPAQPSTAHPSRSYILAPCQTHRRDDRASSWHHGTSEARGCGACPSHACTPSATKQAVGSWLHFTVLHRWCTPRARSAGRPGRGDRG